MSRDSPSGLDDMVPTQYEAETDDTCSETREDSSSSHNDQAANTDNHAPASAEGGPNSVGLENPNNPYSGDHGVFSPHPVDQIPPPQAREWFDQDGADDSGFPAHPIDQIPINQRF
ncbi:uncharacterized protein EI90DRAFT_3126606 [Cantharellus anzutake]|uniref:uncharacterized protein n=1 Tax=Cantharellus anzutake TaxID=1750568 RepID=UPI0019049526|nr:uncharacterized protein EI90DRAFT_3126606 [Cantharellus anzutake]KAF8327961.1 hypothetical protein EI90DRAFT_3126606 [Cantharellus anzutake]